MVVIGWGSELRRDDAVGRRVAEAVAARSLPGVSVLAVHQLTPELAADLVGCRLAIFVDATVTDREVTVHPVEPGAGAAEGLSHHVDPASLVELAAVLGARPRRALVVSVPVEDLEVGTALSPLAASAVGDAVEAVAALVRDGTEGPGAPGAP